MASICLFTVIALIVTATSASGHLSPTSSSLDPPDADFLGLHSDFIDLPRTKGARLFYYFFNSQRCEDDPVVLWLQGGPGAGSEYAMVFENGPVTLVDNKTIIWNTNGWDQVSNIIFVDNPVGTGFSYTTDESDVCHDQTCVSNDLFDFLQAFFKKHWKLSKNPFFITGESFAGHYIPPLASRIHRGNKQREGLPINLQGFAIGNGMVNPEIQYIAFPDYALQMNFINRSDYEMITRDLLPPCLNATRICDSLGGQICKVSFQICSDMEDEIMRIIGPKNDYDLRKQCLNQSCDIPTKIKNAYFNSTSVRSALGVGDAYYVYAGIAYDAMALDRMRSYDEGIPELLEAGIRVLIYAGEYDFVCNWLGNERWVRALNWTGRVNFKQSPTTEFVVHGEKSGKLNNFGPLTFLKVYNAGHMVPQDQPTVSLQMIKRFMFDDLASV